MEDKEAQVMDQIDKACDKLDAPDEVRQRAKEHATGVDITTSSTLPASLAGGAIYYTGLRLGEHYSQKQVAKATGTSHSTVKRLYEKVHESTHHGLDAMDRSFFMLALNGGR